jgi:hypothetical protein
VNGIQRAEFTVSVAGCDKRRAILTYVLRVAMSASQPDPNLSIRIGSSRSFEAVRGDLS